MGIVYLSNRGFILNGGSSGGSAVLTTKTINDNGVYEASEDEADGYSRVTVDVTELPLLVWYGVPERIGDY